MASILEPAVFENKSFQMEKTTTFSPEALRAPFYLRCAALFIDYMLFLALPLGWLMFYTFLGSASSNITVSGTIWFFAGLMWMVNFLLLPLFRGQTIGKMLAGITILNTDGTPVRLFGIFKRNIIGYFLTLLTLGIGFLISSVNKSGRALHDYVAGTVVVYGRKTVN